MAIIVEHAITNFDEVMQANIPTWNQRIEQSKKYGFPLREALPTYPRELSSIEWAHNAVNNIRYRRESDGLMFYTLSGLLHTIYSFFELDSDYRDGIHKLEDIARIKLSIKSGYDTVEKPRFIKVPESIYKHQFKIFQAKEGIVTDITRQMTELVREKRPRQTTIQKPSIEGYLKVFPIIENKPESRVEIASLKIRAFNLPNMGDDMDDVLHMAIQGQ